MDTSWEKGGAISFETGEEGTTFTVRLPLAPDGDGVMGPTTAARGAGG